jgi:carboxymethylenebutenolidase
MYGSMISFSSPSGTTPAYLSLPETGVGPGVVVIQEWWGLVDHIRSVADRFSNAGFAALAPDLYHGASAKSPDQARRLAMALNISQAGEEIHAAAGHLLTMPQVMPKKIGVVGFCMGGHLALYAATQYPDALAACVDFYGMPPKASIDAAKLRVPVLAHFGTTDSMVVNGDVATLTGKISDAGKFIDVYFYDAGHAFFNDSRPDAYNADAAALAWDRTIAFLRDNLH